MEAIGDLYVLVLLQVELQLEHQTLDDERRRLYKRIPRRPGPSLSGQRLGKGQQDRLCLMERRLRRTRVDERLVVLHEPRFLRSERAADERSERIAP